MNDERTPYGMSHSYTPQVKKRTSPVLMAVLVVVVAGFGGVVAWVFFSANSEVPPEDWVVHTSQPGLFEVKVPELPRQETRNLSTEVGLLDLHFHVTENRKRAYAVAYCDYPPEAKVHADPQAVLEGAMGGGVDGMKGALQRSQSISLGGHPGIEFWATLDKGQAHYRLYLVGDRLYQQGIIYADGFEPNPNLFFGSFRLLTDG